jgi:hypothetical protein
MGVGLALGLASGVGVGATLYLLKFQQDLLLPGKMKLARLGFVMAPCKHSGTNPIFKLGNS